MDKVLEVRYVVGYVLCRLSLHAYAFGLELVNMRLDGYEFCRRCKRRWPLPWRRGGRWRLG